MKKFILLIFFISITGCRVCEFSKSKTPIEILDISETQLRLASQYLELNRDTWGIMMLDSLYKPFFNIWNPYIGNERQFLTSMHFEKKILLQKSIDKKNKLFMERLKKELHRKSKKMQEFTGYSTKGKWVLLYGSGSVDLGGFDDGTMLIDLVNKATNNLDYISNMLPHEINHLIYANTLKDKEGSSKVLHRIIGEGFACYVSYLFHEKKKEIYEELNYTEKEYLFCKKYEKGILQILKNTYQLNDEEIAIKLINRKHKYMNIYPGALGYYIGFRIVEEYVKKHGEDSWRDIYLMKPSEVLQKSGILK
ncbi:DUF2268 domain-containing putative Zn-dependent protease [Aureivirga marina]|uniref:DUF2268 domain-containing putative Zn-dependent protease n=1 Tax=Aureivirga marina TaxID=1182451 RepID=UPI0018C96F64|nr:DUF2268 domain-containing putative Zn-dependent protease [Aureivirga marina]